MIVEAESADEQALDGCVKNLHKLPVGKMSSYRLTVCLTTLGWSVSELARRTRQHRNTVQRWLDGKSPIDPAVGAWLETLTAFHIANPSPAAQYVRL